MQQAEYELGILRKEMREIRAELEDARGATSPVDQASVCTAHKSAKNNDSRHRCVLLMKLRKIMTPGIDEHLS